MLEHDRDYYLRRAEEEQELAERAASHGAKIAHLELARNYKARANGLWRQNDGPAEQY